VSGGLLVGCLSSASAAQHTLAIAGAWSTISVSNQTAVFGQPVNLTADVTAGDGPFTYQWQLNGTNILGATNATYGVASAAMTDAGLYTVTVTVSSAAQHRAPV
jgi:PKD repeat protein